MLNTLTHKVVLSLKPSDRAYRSFDGQGLYVEVAPSGAKYFRWKYRFAGKEKTLALGVFPETGLKEARERRHEARKLLAAGIDPNAHRAAAKAAKGQQEATFEVVAREWVLVRRSTWVESHTSKLLGRLEKYIFPHIGKLPVDGVSPAQLLDCLRRIEKLGRNETAHRSLNVCARVFAYAIQTGRASINPARELHGALKPSKVRHHSTIIEPKKIGQLLRAIDGYDGSEVTRAALRLAPLVFVRPGELRQAEWEEFDFDQAEWHIPARRMKMRIKHIVPLSAQSIAVLKELHKLTGQQKLVFPGVRSARRPMSENTVNAALRNLGYEKQELTGHGFRAMASTLLNEQGFDRNAIERQLAHAETNSVVASYNYAQYLPQRKEMMRKWADYLDDLRKRK